MEVAATIIVGLLFGGWFIKQFVHIGGWVNRGRRQRACDAAHAKDRADNKALAAELGVTYEEAARINFEAYKTKQKEQGTWLTSGVD